MNTVLLTGYGGLFAGYKLLKPSVERIIKPDDRKTAAVLYEDGRICSHSQTGIIWSSLYVYSGDFANNSGNSRFSLGLVPAFLWMVLGVCFIGVFTIISQP